MERVNGSIRLCKASGKNLGREKATAIEKFSAPSQNKNYKWVMQLVGG
jgi:hypothetical protein